RRDARPRSGGSLEARGRRRCPLRGDTTSLRRMRLRRPSQIAPSPNLLRAIVLARGNLIPIFVHAAGGRKSTPSIDRRSKPLLEFEPASNRVPKDLGPIDVPKSGHPALRGGVDLEAHDLHKPMILHAFLKDCQTIRLPSPSMKRKMESVRGQPTGRLENVHIVSGHASGPWSREATPGPTSASWSRADTASEC